MNSVLVDAPTAQAESDVLWYEVHVHDSADALRTLARYYQQQLYALLHAYGFQQSDGDDIVNETWLALWNARKKFDTNRSFKPWLYRQLRFKMLDFIRNNRIPLVRQHFELHQVPDESTPEISFTSWLSENAVVDSAGKREIVYLDIQGVGVDLSRYEACLLYLHDILGLDRTEIASRIGKKPKTISVELYRLHVRLRNLLLQHE